MLSSIAGAKPASGLTQNLTRANVRKLCANRGAGWESHSIFAMAVTEWLLMIEYASLDAQRKVGRGVCDFTDDGKTNMSVNTGATSGLGNGSGIDRSITPWISTSSSDCSPFPISLAGIPTINWRSL